MFIPYEIKPHGEMGSEEWGYDILVNPTGRPFTRKVRAYNINNHWAVICSDDNMPSHIEDAMPDRSELPGLDAKMGEIADQFGRSADDSDLPF